MDRDAFLARLSAAGITPDKPLHAVLLVSFEASTDAREAVRKGGVREAVRHELRALSRTLLLRTSLLGVAAVVCALCLGGVGGYVAGRATVPACPVGAVREQAGRLACAWWLTPPRGEGVGG